MPAGGGGGRETLRPPWVREGAPPPAKEGPPAWTMRKRMSNAQDTEPPTATNAVEEQLASVKASLKKQGTRSKPENGVADKNNENVPERVTAKVKELPSKEKKAEPEVKQNKNSEPPKESMTQKKPPIVKAPSKDDVAARKPPVLQRQPSKEDGGVKKWRDPLIEKVYDKIDSTLANEIPKGHTLTKNESLRSLLKPVPPPMPPPLPPKMPPPPEFKKPPPSQDKIKRIEALKSRPRRRPDWTDMMKEVESGRKLKHVDCNDRSSPIISKSNMVKAKGQYVYESEKKEGTVHNQLLKQINTGVKLKTVKTNDRSKPNLDGLRKFRRQLTIEEQLQKSMSHANLAEGITPVKESNEVAPPEDEEVDEMDDIDKVRDDLQSTKQLLALELRNKEAMQRENKRMQARISNLEAELKSERAHVKQEQAKTVISVVDAYDETLVSSLKREVTETKRVSDDLQKKYHRAAEELDEAQSELEEMRRKNAELEKKVEQAMKGINEDEDEEPKSYFLLRHSDFQKQMEKEGIIPSSNQGSRRPSHAQRQASIQESSPEEEDEESSGEEGEDDEEKQKRKAMREIKMATNKIKNLKDKKEKALQERVGLKVQLKNQQKALKVERKKYKALKKEVDKMASLMKETDDDEEENSDEEVEEEEDNKDKSQEEASEEEESESESEEETDSETESESEEEDAPIDKKKENLTARAKKHESSLNALKKGNYLIIANIDRLKDDVMKQREMSSDLQEDLDSVLAEFSA